MTADIGWSSTTKVGTRPFGLIRRYSWSLCWPAARSTRLSSCGTPSSISIQCTARLAAPGA